MPDGLLKIRRGEKRFFKGIATATDPGTTLIIPASPTPIVTIYDDDGQVIAGFNGIPVSGFVAGPLAEVYAYYGLDTKSPVDLAAQFVTMVFKYTTIGSDGQTRVCEPSIGIEIEEAYT